MSNNLYNKIFSEAGNVIIYIFAAMGIFGFLTFIMTNGTKESVAAADVQKMTSLVKTDLETIHSAIQECVLMYPDPVDVNADGNINATDNPSAPYPLYPPNGSNTTMWWGTPSQNIKTIVCPGEYMINNGSKVFDNDSGKFFSILDNTDFTVKYLTNDAPPVMIRIEVTYSKVTTVWSEVMSRLDAMLDPSNVGIVDIDTSSNTLYYYIKR